MSCGRRAGASGLLGRVGRLLPAVALALLCASAPRVRARQSRPGLPRDSDAPPLYERQRLIRQRLERLESRMLRLTHRLAETEPEKVERLRDALDRAGRRDLKRRSERIAALLHAGQFGDAERAQRALLADLADLLEVLTGSAAELDRLRVERARLARYRRVVRGLMEEQTEDAYRLAQVQRPAGDRAALPASVPALGRLERLQRGTQEKADRLHRRMREETQPAAPPPGARQTADAAEAMRKAADAIGERQLERARRQQQAALESLQQALNELDDALRQVRREELEETLATLEVRLRSMLERQEQVGAVLAPFWDGQQPAQRRDAPELARAAETQRRLAQDCRATLRILVDEGSTVVVPELVRQLAADMQQAADRLAQRDPGPPLPRLFADIMALLKELIGALETRRAAEAQAPPAGQPRAGPSPGALLPGSAELKLLRSAQMRINRRTRALAQAGGPASKAQLERLAARQRRLARLARQMYERR